MAKVNRKWHDTNKLPKKATTKQRVKWQLAHAKACACRPMPAKIQRLTEKPAPKPTKKVTTKKPAKKSK